MALPDTGHDHIGISDSVQINRWIGAAQRQLAIATDAESPDEIRNNATDMVFRALVNAIDAIPKHKRDNNYLNQKLN